MIHAGAGEGLPLLRRNRALVADRERGNDAGVGRIRQCGPDAGTRETAQALDPVAGPVHHLRHPVTPGARANVAGRAQVALQQPRLVVESMRVGSAARALQPYGQPPALPGLE